MGLLDGYFDPEQFQASGGLLGRLLSLPQMRGLYQPGASLDPQVPADSGQSAATPLSVPLPVAWPTSPTNGPMPQFGRADFFQTPQPQPPGPGERNTGDKDSSGDGHAAPGNEASSIAGGQPPGLSNAAYLEIPTNPNQAAGELLGIQDSKPDDSVNGKDFVSGVREGNVRLNQDGSLDVTNGTVVTLSWKDGRAKTVTVTNADVAHIDRKTGEVVIQKSPFRNGI